MQPAGGSELHVDATAGAPARPSSPYKEAVAQRLTGDGPPSRTGVFDTLDDLLADLDPLSEEERATTAHQTLDALLAQANDLSNLNPDEPLDAIIIEDHKRKAAAAGTVQQPAVSADSQRMKEGFRDAESLADELNANPDALSAPSVTVASPAAKSKVGSAFFEGPPPEMRAEGSPVNQSRAVQSTQKSTAEVETKKGWSYGRGFLGAAKLLGRAAAIITSPITVPILLVALPSSTGLAKLAGLDTTYHAEDKNRFEKMKENFYSNTFIGDMKAIWYGGTGVVTEGTAQNAKDFGKVFTTAFRSLASIGKE